MRAAILWLVTSVMMCATGLVVAALPTVSWAGTMTMRSPIEQVPASYFGLHIHRLVRTQPWYPKGDKITPWPPSIKFGSWRLWDAYVAWKHLEPERGKWDFQTLDKYLALAEEAGIDLVLPLGLSPAWASARPNEPSSYDPGNAAEPRNIEDWRNYVGHVARRYKGRIKHYELWNEVNVKGFYSGSQEKLVELARVAYQTLKEVDPSIIFVSPSVVGEGHHPWLDRYLAKGGAKYLDAVGYHFYMPKAPPEAMLTLIRQVKNVMKKHGLEDKPLWNTETGWWIDNNTNTPRTRAVPPGWVKVDSERAAAYVARALLLSWTAGVSRIYWYSWDSIDMGLIQPGSLELKPAGVAFDTMSRLLTGALLKQCTVDDKIWICQIVTANEKKPVLAVWTEDDVGRNWKIPSSWNIMGVERLDGSHFKPNERSIWIGPAPLLMKTGSVAE